MGEEEAVEEEQGGEQEAPPPETEKGEEGQVLFQNFTSSTLVYTVYAYASTSYTVYAYASTVYVLCAYGIRIGTYCIRIYGIRIRKYGVHIGKYVCARKPLRCIQEEKAVGAEELPEEPTREDGGAGAPALVSHVSLSSHRYPSRRLY